MAISIFKSLLEKLQLTWQRYKSDNFKISFKNSPIQLNNCVIIFNSEKEYAQILKGQEIPNNLLLNLRGKKTEFSLKWQDIEIHPELIYQAVQKNDFKQFLSGKFLMKVSKNILIIVFGLKTDEQPNNLVDQIRGSIADNIIFNFPNLTKTVILSNFNIELVPNSKSDQIFSILKSSKLKF